MATGRTPGTMVPAQESAFGCASRLIILPHPDRRADTVAYIVDLATETMLAPIRISMDCVKAYRILCEASFGQRAHDSDNGNTSQTPIATYLNAIIGRFLLGYKGEMPNSLWHTLESSKAKVHDLAKELALMYGLCERVAYVAFRPGSCTPEERGLTITLNFINCPADFERGREVLNLLAQRKVQQ